MSKAVLISIRPKWCELIANGTKTVEVRKSRPKLHTPFKCYIYCTQPRYPHEDYSRNFTVAVRSSASLSAMTLSTSSVLAVASARRDMAYACRIGALSRRTRSLMMPA